jgi:predicted flap endonuclease-1-like 5' DNA nuclease
MANIQDIEGIGPAYGEKLAEVGVKTLADLLAQGGSPSGREALAEKTGLSEAQILKWVNRADLDRVNGVGSEFADLLEQAGVDSVPELAQRNPGSLAAKLAEVNAAKSLVRRVPAEGEVAEWVQHAKSLDRAVTH